MERPWIMTRWEWQARRIERYYDRYRANVESNEPATDERILDGRVDDAISFFVQCFHLKDWPGRDERYPTCRPPESSSETKACGRHDCPECHIRTKPELMTCADIANGYKHLDLVHGKRFRSELEISVIPQLNEHW